MDVEASQALQKLSRFIELLLSGEEDEDALTTAINSFTRDPDLQKKVIQLARDRYSAEARPELKKFLGLMEMKLQKHDPERKQSWKGGAPAHHIRQLRVIVDELEVAVEEGRQVGLKAADAANHAMMLADQAGELEDA